MVRIRSASDAIRWVNWRVVNPGNGVTKFPENRRGVGVDRVPDDGTRPGARCREGRDAQSLGVSSQ